MHGRIVEKCITDDQSAVDKLIKKPVKYHMVMDPESGKDKQEDGQASSSGS